MAKMLGRTIENALNRDVCKNYQVTDLQCQV